MKNEPTFYCITRNTKKLRSTPYRLQYFKFKYVSYQRKDIEKKRNKIKYPKMISTGRWKELNESDRSRVPQVTASEKGVRPLNQMIFVQHLLKALHRQTRYLNKSNGYLFLEMQRDMHTVIVHTTQ